ncbi:MAG TPA: hydantoinase/oxoprolinase family protein [Steroidobacteraceae bacterium]|nr:hydantoinase/oxoprolinase family protein [Steroidobacteraceae bacterium]
MASRIGVDIGGTFTDLIYFDDQSGQILVGKAPTVADQPEVGCIEAVNQVGLSARLKDVEFFLHGTTVGLNALLERRGAVVGLLCTAGFRDVLELRRGDRNDMYNLNWTPPEPLVPRRLRFGVRGRVLADKTVTEPLDENDVRRGLDLFRTAGVTAIAVAYMNAYANGCHEVETERILREAGWDGAISLSHRVSGEYREYERTSTTVVDAFVRARISDYLGRLEGGLRDQRFRGTCLITRSGGGSMTFAEANERPFETIMSGPVAGAEGAAELSRRLDLGDLITADVGGTSFDTCVIVDGRTQVLYQGRIADHPLQTPWVDVRSIGAGGGSIARVDSGGLLLVGPESAGAVPGPACYGRGGVEPTVTDAAFYLGMLGDGHLASGLVLDRRKAESALQRVATALRYDVEQTARGIMAIAGSMMANTIREITIEHGLDPRKMTLLAFGGAGPLMATELARELEIQHIVVPPHAGNFSAWGLLGADLVQSRARTQVMRLSEAAIAKANETLAELFTSLADHNKAIGGGAVREVALDMRFRGQEHTLTVVPPSTDGRLTGDTDEIRSTFSRSYVSAFETALDADIEIVSIRASLRRPLPRRNEARAAAVSLQAERSLQAFSFATGRYAEFQLVHRFSMAPGMTRVGPLVIVEPTTTTYVDGDFVAEVDAAGCLHLRHRRG